MSIATSDEEVAAMALDLIAENGAKAAELVSGLLDELDSPGALNAALVWRRVLKAIERLQATEPLCGVRH